MIFYKKENIRHLGELDKVLYELGLVALGIVIAAVLLYVITGFSVLDIKFGCMFNLVTGYACPGCGGTRSIKALLGGDILKCLYYYPPLIYAVIVYLIFMLRCFIYKHFGVFKYKDGAVVKYVYIFVGLVIAQWIAKILAQAIWGFHWV